MRRGLSVHWSLQNGAVSDQLREFGWSGGNGLKKEWEVRKWKEGFQIRDYFMSVTKTGSEPGLQV